MNLPNPDQLLPQMAAALDDHLSRLGIAEPRFVGIRTGGVWVAQALLAAGGRERPWASSMSPSIATISRRTDCTRRCARPNCHSRSRGNIWYWSMMC